MYLPRNPIQAIQIVVTVHGLVPITNIKHVVGEKKSPVKYWGSNIVKNVLG
jgi:hypothetical protein